MFSEMTITVIVDDSDPSIEYTGSWFTDLPNDALSESLGNTLHNATGAGWGSQFTYHFNGD